MSLWDTIAGVDPAVDHGLPELPRDAPKGREAERILAAQQLEQFTILAQQSTKIAAQLQGLLTNDVLGWGTWIFDASASPMPLQFKTAIGALVVRNLSAANTVSVVSGGQSGAAQMSGRGVWLVPPGVRDVVPITDHQATLYGTAADKLCWQAFAVGALPVVS